ncbi:peroxiredoxin [Gluconacetobacter entanii]|uniref:thioredoxin-dependent peroxiredoxin n=1 Tax=Gluconacetobacter entanii TaxID=108528 RepID=A0ABT3K605_9PROT|nr:peroxiredoxin [Gluconacetobacter entanii]MCW4590852.1 peroxiredoxin [Gluconacetobacter entanii]MCW4593322.1 peroxiredoxin [Gluconacetobacter entanii]NPC90178.1 peroxiredoxin [Gluconacetobacter entanii]
MKYFYRRPRWSWMGIIMPLVAVMAFAGIVAWSSARAALPAGSSAPMFVAPAAQAGKEFSFHLADALRNGPVVVYFYPAAFTRGCTIEAHEFAEAMDSYHELGASVIGVSMDDIKTLDRFSVSECHGRFPVASDPTGTIARLYDSRMPVVHYASRTSYVIAPDGKIIFTYSAMSPDEHVRRTLDAIRAWRAGQPVPSK